MNIDMARIITVDDKAVAALAARLDGVKTECRRRIYAVADEIAQMNLASDAAAGLLTADQMATYKTGLLWRDGMRNAIPALVSDADADYLADASWPPVPVGVIELAALF